MYNIHNYDCIKGAQKYISDKSVDLMICDPPFGINETKFKNLYNRDDKVIKGYVEAPDNYYNFSCEWIKEAKRILKNNGSMYIISGWSNSDIIGRVIRELDLFLINKLIWNFPFGVYTKKKYVTSHYEIFYIKKTKKSKVTFNRECRFDNSKDIYKDLQSVWQINKEYHTGSIKNENKLPEELIRKIIQYSSNKENIVCDFFLGNFTTAIVSKKLNRLPIGFELNSMSYKRGIDILQKIKIGSGLKLFYPTKQISQTEDIFEEI